MIGVLVKNRLRALFGSVVGRAGRGKEIKKATPLKITLFGLLYLFVIGVFLFLSVSISYLLATALLPGAGWLYYLIFMGLSLTLVFILSIFETKTELFECKDNDLLLSMPIKPRDIVASRIIVVLIYNYIINAVIMLPAIVLYAIFGKSILGVFGGLLVFLLLPLFATALASFVGYLVAEISRKLKYKNIVTVIFTLALLGAYFWIIEILGDNLEALIESLAGITDKLAEEHKFLLFLGNAAMLKPLSILAVAVVSVLSAACAYILISSAYIRIVTNITGASKTVYKEKRLKRGSVMLALAKKDIRHFFSSPVYILNGALGLIMGLVIAVLALVNGDIFTLLVEELGMSEIAVSSLAVALLIIISSTTIISACSLSIEGKELWIIKTMPIQPKTVLFSKALMHFIISAPLNFVAAVLILIATAPPALYWIFYILAVLFANALFALCGILINVAFPKFDYENDAQAVKQSLATLISMLLCMLLGIALMVGTLILSIISEILGVILLLLVPIVLIAVCVLLLIYPASERYKKLNM